MALDINDSNFISDLRYGKEDAIAHIHYLYFNALCYYADQFINDKEEAKDITSEAFLVLWERRKDFHSVGEVRAFLFRVVKNKCIDFFRKGKSRTLLNPQFAGVLADETAGIDSALITAQVLQAIHQEIEMLPTQCKNICKAIFVDGKSTTEVASELSISTQTVLNQKSKAVRVIRHRLLERGMLVSNCAILAVLTASDLLA